MNIYLAQQEGTDLVKIGITKKNPNVRLKELQTGNATKIVLIETFSTKFDFKLESSLHAYYKTKKVNSEWFTLSMDDISDFIHICEKLEDNLMMLKSFTNPFI